MIDFLQTIAIIYLLFANYKMRKYFKKLVVDMSRFLSGLKD